ncbi:MAG: lipopolysaccharide assembly protein LapA domain-containing protein [Rhodoglobus sp.]|nr:lipopolysaccharide assembly protein LapA domain-containing protein [Rhodoglobus sp.]
MTSEQSGTPRKPEAPQDIHAAEAFPATTRTGVVWVAIIGVLLLLTVIIIFILQNQGRTEVHFFGWTGVLPMGVALLIAVVAGGALVAVGGAARIMQLRRQQRKVARKIKAKKVVVSTPTE